MVLEAGKSKIKFPADSVPDESSFWLVDGHLFTASSHSGERERERSGLSFSSYKDTDPTVVDLPS